MTTNHTDETGGDLMEQLAPSASSPTADLHHRLAARAEAEGLLDVAYAITDSPIGPLLVAVTTAGLVRVAFEREGHDAVLDSEQPKDGEVLEGLRARALGRVDHEEEHVDTCRARDHRPHEALVPRHVDERDAAAVAQIERRIAEGRRDKQTLRFQHFARGLVSSRKCFEYIMFFC